MNLEGSTLWLCSPLPHQIGSFTEWATERCSILKWLSTLTIDACKRWNVLVSVCNIMII